MEKQNEDSAICQELELDQKKKMSMVTEIIKKFEFIFQKLDFTFKI